MAWTTPTTTIVGDVISPTYWNTNARDNLNFLYNNSWVKIQEIIVSSQNNIVFSSLGSLSFNHLMIIGALRSSLAATTDLIYLQFNGVGGTSYSFSFIQWKGDASLTNGSLLNSASFDPAYICGGTAPTSSFSPVYILIPDYSSSSINKVITSVVGTKINTSATTDLLYFQNTGYFQNTAAITSIKIGTNSASNFVAGSYLDLYGLP
jgi:hypothetical protein